MSKSKQFKFRLKNFFNKVTVKQILLIILFGILISLSSIIIGYFEFSNIIKNIYNNELYEISQLVKQNINITDLERNIKIVGENFYLENSPELDQISDQPGYQQLVEQSNYLQNSFSGLDILIGNFNKSYNETYLKYLEAIPNPTDNDLETIKFLKEDGDDVVISYYRSPNITPEERKLNIPGGLFLVSQSDKVSLEKLYREKTVQFSDTEMIMGDTHEIFTLFSVQDPILNNNGQVIGFINISLTIGVIQQLLARYIFLVGILTILLGILFIFIYIRLNRRLFLNPILSIIDGISNFVKNNNKVSKSLSNIKTGDEIQTLAESILKLENDINEYIKNLAEVTKERERVQAELDLAKTIQMSMLPQEIPEIANKNDIKLSALMNPAREVGGDFYNYFMIDEDHLGFVIGDVSGKGVPAALFMMIGTILIKTQSLPEEAVNVIMERVNDILSENNAEMLFITAWMGIYEFSTGKVTFVNAGHEPPLLIHKNGELEFIKTKPNLALATFGGLPYRLNEIDLKKGDKIFLYTDGVIEAQNSNKEFYKSERLVNIVKSTYQENLTNIINNIKKDIDNFVNGADQFDDITIVGLEIKEEPDNE